MKSNLSKPKLIHSILGLLLTALVVAAFLTKWYPTEFLEYKTYDLRSSVLRGSKQSPVVIVSVDDDMIRRLGSSQQRSYLAKAIDFLSNQGAAYIAIDIFPPDYKKSNELLLIEHLKEIFNRKKLVYKEAVLSKINEILEREGKGYDSNAILSYAFKNAGNVILPIFFTTVADKKIVNEKAADYMITASKESDGISVGTEAEYALTWPPEFSKDALSLGHINLFPDQDGVLRKETLLINYKDRHYPSLALQLALRYMQEKLQSLTTADGIKFDNLYIPDKEMLINFKSQKEEFPIYSLDKIIEGQIPSDIFKDKIVLIGLTGQNSRHMYRTSAGADLSAIEITASALENIINQSYITRPPLAWKFDLSALILFGILVSFIMPVLRPAIVIVLSILLILAWNSVALFLFIYHGVWLKIVYVTTILFLGAQVSCIREGKTSFEKREINKITGLSYQKQGRLDMALKKFMHCPVEDNSVKDLLYNLGQDYEKEKLYNKSISIYEHILKAGPYRELKERVEAFKKGEFSFKSDREISELGRYSIVRELGRGAMGVVYLASDPKINRPVAIKTILYENLSEDEVDEMKRRFYKEAEAAGKLSHPNIVSVYDIGEEHNMSFIAMEYLEGTDLKQYVKKDNLMTLSQILKVIISVANALDFANKNGIVHRDIKPANIILMNNNEIKVADFGIARIAESQGDVTSRDYGTPSYMSPEQIRFSKSDGRSDIYSLGIIFYELITGEKPFKGDNISGLMYNITTGNCHSVKEIRPKVPDCISTIISKMMALSPDERYQRGREVVKAILQCKKTLLKFSFSIYSQGSEVRGTLKDKECFNVF